MADLGNAPRVDQLTTDRSREEIIMELREQIDLIRGEMQGDWTLKLTDNTYTDIIVPLYTVLAEIAQPQDYKDIVFGDIDKTAEDSFRALLVTQDHFYYADFGTVELHNPTTDEREGTDLSDGYNLRILPLSSLKSITINNIYRDNFNGAITKIDYTVHLADMEIAIPVRGSFRDNQKERELLKHLRSKLV